MRFEFQSLWISLLFLVLSFPSSLLSEEKTTASEAGPVNYDASLRTRYELIDWFDAGVQGVDNRYNFPTLKGQLGLGCTLNWVKLYIQGEYDQAFDLPKDADNGPGALYRNFNGGDRDPGSVYVRQGYAQFPDISESGVTFLAGRSLYGSGAEVKSASKTLDWLKTKRIADRLIGPFEYTFGRSFDGVRLDYANSEFGTFTAHASHPTQGGFVTDGLKTITAISLVTAALTHPYTLSEGSLGEAQLFYYFYDDERGTIKTDNRASDIRAADSEDISINNFGAHWMHAYKVGTGTWDGLLWGVLQEGDWGAQDHGAGAMAAEFGYRFDEIYGKPWLRLGYNWSSGDDDALDGDHSTFFQMLPTARAYAMTPFYNLMNLQDFLIQGVWQPDEKVTFRSDIHFPQATQDEDLLYSGAGANSRSGPFGFAGVGSQGKHAIGTLLDFNLWIALHKNAALYIYYGHLLGGDLSEAAFAENDEIDYGFIELTLKL